MLDLSLSSSIERPCPFCGSYKLKVDCKAKAAGHNGLDMKVERLTFSVRCNVCHARGGAFGGLVIRGFSRLAPCDGKPFSLPEWATTREALEEKAISAWNRRVSNAKNEG